MEDPWAALNELLTYEEVADVCSNLKQGVYAGPPLWKFLFQVYQKFFVDFSISKSMKTGITLLWFEGKSAKANNKDNYTYKGITLFPTLCKAYEMILLNRLEKFANEKGYFSELQFGFRDNLNHTKVEWSLLVSQNLFIYDR